MRVYFSRMGPVPQENGGAHARQSRSSGSSTKRWRSRGRRGAKCLSSSSAQSSSIWSGPIWMIRPRRDSRGRRNLSRRCSIPEMWDSGCPIVAPTLKGYRISRRNMGDLWPLSSPSPFELRFAVRPLLRCRVLVAGPIWDHNHHPSTEHLWGVDCSDALDRDPRPRPRNDGLFPLRTSATSCSATFRIETYRRPVLFNEAPEDGHTASLDHGVCLEH